MYSDPKAPGQSTTRPAAFPSSSQTDLNGFDQLHFEVLMLTSRSTPGSKFESMVQEGVADVKVAAASSLPGPWLSPRSRSMQARANMERKKRKSFPPTSSSGDSSQVALSEQDRAPQRRPLSLGLAPGMGAGIKSNLVSEVLPEVSFLVICRTCRAFSSTATSLHPSFLLLLLLLPLSLFLLLFGTIYQCLDYSTHRIVLLQHFI